MELTRDDYINLTYVIAGVLFIFGLKGLTHPRTAVRGNLLGALGMLVAVVATLFSQDLVGPWLILVGVILGTVIGVVLAVKIEMTAMPQLVALFNGFGGGVSALGAWAELAKNYTASKAHATEITARTKELGQFDALIEKVKPFFGDVANEVSITILGTGPDPAANTVSNIAIVVSGFIGAVTLLGSLFAFAKLQEIKQFKKPIRLPAHQIINAVLFGACLLLGVLVIFLAGSLGGLIAFVVLLLAASTLGVFLVSPIGGADMPVVIALLNSYSGLAAAATGFVIDNNVLIIAGSLVGASGIILSRIMCKAMNRSLTNVLFGVMEAAEGSATSDEVYEGRIKSTVAEEVAMLFDSAERVIIVPGYGMAVAQAQHTVRDLMDVLEGRGIEVLFAIHPVAGRMPGHMNVLLAEAEVPYEKLMEMDTVNPMFQQTDIALVIGANDVVNPVARTDPKSPIAGMPILDVDKAKTVVIVKRSLSPGFAGIPNPLFAADNCLMFFGDGKKAMLDLLAALKEG